MGYTLACKAAEDYSGMSRLAAAKDGNLKKMITHGAKTRIRKYNGLRLRLIYTDRKESNY